VVQHFGGATAPFDVTELLKLGGHGSAFSGASEPANQQGAGGGITLEWRLTGQRLAAGSDIRCQLLFLGPKLPDALVILIFVLAAIP
jgi:hypothetical protein